MSTHATPLINIYAPDGTLGEVPYEKLHDALQAGGKLAVQMKAPDGTNGYIPADKTSEAIKAGGQIVPFNIAGPQSEKEGFAKAALGTLSGLLKPAGQNPYPGMGVEAKQAAAQESADADAARKQAGYSKLYRAAAPVAQAVGADVPGMEKAAAAGDKGGVYGHAVGSAIPVAAGAALHATGSVVKKAFPAASEMLREGATKDYEAVLNPTKETTKYQTNKMMPRLLEERPTALTREGLAEKAGKQAEAAGQEVESAVQNLTGSMKIKPVVDGLNNLKKQYQVNGTSLRPEVDTAIDAVTSQLTKMGPEISYQDAVKARRILDQAVAEVKGYQGKDLSDSSMANIRKETANAFRSELGKASPDLATANAKFHFWNSLNDVLEQTIERKTGQRPSVGAQIQTAAAGTAGLATGGLTSGLAYGAAMKMLGDAVHSTGWKTASANLKLNLADAMSNGNFGKIPELLSRAGIVTQVASANSAPSEPVNDQKNANE